MPRIDLDAARRERRGTDEAEPITVTLNGHEFTLAEELPFEVVEKLGPLRDASAADKAPEVATAILSIFDVLLGEEQFDSFRKERPSMDDLLFLLQESLKAYGVTLGESEASSN